MTDRRLAFRTCPLCEAGCGLELTIEGDQVVRIRGDRDDVFSHGYICPKGSTLKQLHEDPDRLRTPLIKRNGAHEPASWDEAWALIADKLPAVIDRHGRNAVAVYVGNPTAHNLSAMTTTRSLIRAVGSRYRFSASTVDQVPKQVACGWMFGTPVTVPVPDIDRTDYLFMLGANPYASNGSLATAPDWPGRLERLRARGGKVVVVDPRRSKTAQESDEWVAIKPGTDAHLLMAMLCTLVEEGLTDTGAHLTPLLNGWDEVTTLARQFTPERVAEHVGIAAPDIRRLARELAAAPTAVVYGRIGTCTQSFGTTASWLVDVLNIATGNLDAPGGAMFALPATGSPNARGEAGHGDGFSMARGHSRVRKLPEVMSEYPVVALAEEITTPGEGQLRALITVAGNPILSTPQSEQLDAAFATLDFMVSVDIYLNETTRHADVILPAPSHLSRPHYDVLLLQFALHNVANFSPAVFPLADGEPDEWEVLLKLAAIAAGSGADADPSVLDDRAAAGLIGSAIRDSSSNVSGRDSDELLALASADGRRGPERMLDIMLRTGPYGDGFGAVAGGLSLEVLQANPHGVDLGALQPRLPDALRTVSGKIECAPAALIADVARMAEVLDEPSGGLTLVGRRDLRSNNSWMHNIDVLVKGKERCTLQVNPVDAQVHGLTQGGYAQVSSRTGTVTAPIHITDDIRPGVVSLPHGWGHDFDGVSMGIAQKRPGVNSNILADTALFDPVSGNAVLNGIPVTLTPV